MDRANAPESATNGGFCGLVRKYWDYYPTIPIDCLR